MLEIKNAIDDYIRVSTMRFVHSLLMIPVLIIFLPAATAFSAYLTGGYHFLEEFVNGLSNIGTYRVVALMFIVINLHRLLKKKNLAFLLKEDLGIEEKERKINKIYLNKYGRILNLKVNSNKQNTNAIRPLQSNKPFNSFTRLVEVVKQKSKN